MWQSSQVAHGIPRLLMVILKFSFGQTGLARNRRLRHRVQMLRISSADLKCSKKVCQKHGPPRGLELMGLHRKGASSDDDDGKAQPL